MALKQQYLDAIEQARAEHESRQKEHEKSARTAYIDKMTDLRDRPQQLRSLGLSGGVEDEDLRGILDEYRAKYEELKEWQREFVEEYKREIARQQRRMDAAVAEYNARNALEDYNASLKSSGSSRSSRSSSRGSGASKGGTGGKNTGGTVSGMSPALIAATEGREKGHIWAGSHGNSSYYSGAHGGGSGGGVR